MAAALWDLYDKADDDNLHNLDRGADGFADRNKDNRVPFSQLLGPILSGKSQADITAYWGVLRKDLKDPNRILANVMAYNYFDNP